MTYYTDPDDDGRQSVLPDVWGTLADALAGGRRGRAVADVERLGFGWDSYTLHDLTEADYAADATWGCE